MRALVAIALVALCIAACGALVHLVASTAAPPL